MSYLDCSHWLLLVVNVLDKTVSLYDSLKIILDERYLNAFTKFLSECLKVSSFSKLSKTQCCVKEAPKRPYQTDDYNCGLFIMHYIKCIYENVPLGDQIDPNNHRMRIRQELITYSDNLFDKCIYCAKKIEYEMDDVACGKCHRSLHAHCTNFERSFTDEEDNYDYTGITPKKKENLMIYKRRNVAYADVCHEISLNKWFPVCYDTIWNKIFRPIETPGS